MWYNGIGGAPADAEEELAASEAASCHKRYQLDPAVLDCDTKVRKTPNWPRNWPRSFWTQSIAARSSLLVKKWCLHSTVWAKLHPFGQT
jgi:hypothetical protein